uniref:Uncharacterized protein n=1 Tax=Ciona savignyi TaxID=51511 RepID=H2Y8V3_CIOSA
MSIHANAIALKYLSDDQLMKIAPGNPPVAPSMPGMSLISPTNMTMGTRRYMQKYGLIDGQDSDEEDSRGASPAFDRPPDDSREKQPSNQWSQLQNKLGETIDMVAPFLQDL